MLACTQVMELSDAFSDDELFGSLRARIFDHLRGCVGCTSMVDEKVALQTIRKTVRRLGASHS